MAGGIDQRIDQLALERMRVGVVGETEYQFLALFLDNGQGHARKTADKFKARCQADNTSTDNDNSNLRRNGE